MDEEREQKRLTKRQRQWAEQDQRSRDDAVKALMAHRNGRDYLWWLLDIGKAIGINPFTGNALSTGFQCGEQNVGQQIMAHLLEVAPDSFLQMLKEKSDERATRTQSFTSESTGTTSVDGGDSAG